MFQLTAAESENLKSQIVISSWGAIPVVEHRSGSCLSLLDAISSSPVTMYWSNGRPEAVLGRRCKSKSLTRWNLYETRAVVMAKVKSERELVDHGIRVLVEALGCSGTARFIRHFSKGNTDYLEIQEKFFKEMRLAQI